MMDYEKQKLENLLVKNAFLSKQKTPVKTGVFCCKDINKQKQQPQSDKLSDYFIAINRANRYGNIIVILCSHYTIFFPEIQLLQK